MIDMITHRVILHVPGEEKTKQNLSSDLASARKAAIAMLTPFRNRKDAADLVAVIEEVKWEVVEHVVLPPRAITIS